MTSTTSLRTFTDSHRIEAKGGEWNVTAMGGGWIGKFDIPAASYEQFLELTHDYIFTKRGACSLLEQHLKVEGKVQGPILIDLDFKFPSGGPLTRRFTADQLQRFVNAYVTAFYKFFKQPAETGPLQFFVMLKPAPEDDKAHGCHKDGVHIVCPNITTYPEIQFALRGYLLQSGIMESIFGPTGFTNAPQDCFDIRVIATNNWFLYGACKPDKAWYKVETLYEATDSCIEEVDASELTPLELTKMFSIRYGHNKVTDIVLKEGVDVEWLGLVQRWGAGSNFAKAAKSPSLKASSGAEPSPFSLDTTSDGLIQISGISVRSDHQPDDIKIAYRLIRECLIPERRVREYHDWVKMGMLLHNIAPGEESLKEWMDFSRRIKGSESTADTVYTEKWKLLPAESSAINRGRKPLMMGSLHHWAKEDNPAKYREIMSESNRDSALLNDSGSHVSMAEQVIRMYRHEFRCTPLKKGATAAAMDWFQFSGHTWRNLKTCMRLRERLSNEVRHTFIEADRKVGEQITKATNEDDRQRLEAKRKAIFKIEGHLQNSGYKDSVMKESVEKFYDEEFLQNMNMDATTVGFSNGVLELRHKGSDGKLHTHFRPGMPDDCISFQMGRGCGSESIPYIPYDPAAASPPPEYAEITDFFTKIYPDPVLREYVLTLLSACLEGANREQKFYIMTGGGSNGKSKIVELMSSTFGEYQETLGTTAITRKRPESGAANPDLVVLKCKRFVSMVEPDEGEKINTASMKQLSGEDVVKARALFQDQDAFVIMARIFMCCNDMPPVSSMDNGTWRRLRVIPHVAKFVDHGQAVDESKHIHYKDLLLDAKIRRWRPYFASLLVWYYDNHYLVHGLKEPAAVVAASNKYKEENDAFAAFCQECIVKETGSEVKVKDILARHKEWSKFNPGKKVMRKEDILTRLTEIYGKPVDAAGKTYAGFRVAYEDEDVSGNVIAMI